MNGKLNKIFFIKLETTISKKKKQKCLGSSGR